MRPTSIIPALLVLCCLLHPVTALAVDRSTPQNITSLGEALFFDVNLSHKRTQSCATCHDPERAFTDSRDNDINGAVSLGDDGISLGDRNAPTIGYASLGPRFQRNEKGEYIGGLFHDGRAATLSEQAAGPLINPLEMALTDQMAVMNRVQENPGYVLAMKNLFGDAIFTDSHKVYRAVAKSIAAFEKTPGFAPFDSRYDRYLRGEYQMTKRQELGRQLFFSDLINCNSCHLQNLSPLHTEETFTNYRYHNIGVPTNTGVREKNDVKIDHRDRGLLENPGVDDPAQSGKFKVPTLRNIAVSSPYMHNGIFEDLRTVLLFYGKYIVSNETNRINPETGKQWGEAEVKENMDLDLLGKGQPLDENNIAALLAFLETLTDKRYEHLLEK